MKNNLLEGFWIIVAILAMSFISKELEKLINKVLFNQKKEDK